MQIKRNYSQSFFGKPRRQFRTVRLFLAVLFIIGFLYFADSNFSTLQRLALNAIGQSPRPTPFASELAIEGLNLYLAGDLVGGQNLLEQAVTQQPQNIDYLYEYGQILLEVGDSALNQQALDLGEQAVQINPDDPRGYVIQARATDLMGDHANAIIIAQTGLRVDRNFSPLYVVLSSAYQNLDRYDAAIESVEAAIERDPLNPDARRVYAYALSWLGNHDEAVRQLEQAIQINPNLTGPYFELAGLYRSQASLAQDIALQMQFYADAIALYEHVLTLQPNNARAYQRICATFNQIGEHRRAQNYCEDAIQLSPDFAEAYVQLGQSQYSQRNYESAIESFETCLQLEADRSFEQQDVECHYIRGLAHYYLAECQQAWDILIPVAELYSQTDPNGTVMQNTIYGLQLITENCTAFAGRSLPATITQTLR